MTEAPPVGLVLPGAPDGVEWSRTHIAILDPSLSYETFERVVGLAGSLGDAARWWLGDLLLFGDNRYGERHAQALEYAGVGEHQLTRYRKVCERVAKSRRRENLSFSHHEEVSPLEPADQARLLERAERDGWSREQLREAVRDVRAIAPARPQQRQEVLDTADVDAARGLTEVRETLVRVGSGLEPETAEAVGIPSAIRAVDEAGAAIRKAAARVERPSLVDASRRVVTNATLSGGFYMVETDVFNAFAAVVADNERG